jgi:hypothetical protein
MRFVPGPPEKVHLILSTSALRLFLLIYQRNPNLLLIRVRETPGLSSGMMLSRGGVLDRRLIMSVFSTGEITPKFL